ncbi:hypothetical protein ABFS82_06G179900 [Erythranthe guttata]|uniref:CRIB domain-containing protein n=1 Tax=Erythranthe guttata TaxID=4155 RepID=A0A022RH27_ERYGU|nr:PREDICTED: CRIB domain-containing protein RIC4-like [Erythranthe guttata]EYU39707.1 hypothetical protein MIMGU_mgv1a015231mg [Erythranthe guttata]|eukprot:XP_012834817.1 PREDICTED: CRIB domain-containing protein RIC4-like [Erythranthe guttata]
MRDRMERFVLLPFTAGCIAESSIAVTKPTPTRTRDGEMEQEEEYDDENEEESLSGENSKSPSSLLPLPIFQKLFKNIKNFSTSFAYKDELEETETRMEIGFPTNVKHVTHIGLDGCASSILSKGWNNFDEPETKNLPSVPLTPVELAMTTYADKPSFRSLLQTK